MNNKQKILMKCLTFYEFISKLFIGGNNLKKENKMNKKDVVVYIHLSSKKTYIPIA